MSIPSSVLLPFERIIVLMKRKKLLIIPLAVLAIGLGLYIADLYAKGNSVGWSGIKLEVVEPYYDGEEEIIVGPIDYDYRPSNEKVTLVVTEPFHSLEQWESSAKIAEVTTDTGHGTLSLAPGKYGIYYIHNGKKILYSDLKLANQRNDILRDKQGPWYIEVKPFQKTKIQIVPGGNPPV